jgi:hypothetical protein
VIYQRLQIVAGTFVAYTLIFNINQIFFGFTEIADGVHWIYLPSGLRLMFVLIFGGAGAVGVGLASIYLNSLFHFDGALISAVGAGVISGLAPYLARYVCHRKLDMDYKLTCLSVPKLLYVSLVFALLSVCLHQLFYGWAGHTSDWVVSMGAMFFGDLMGTITMLYLVKWVMLKAQWQGFW